MRAVDPNLRRMGIGQVDMKLPVEKNFSEISGNRVQFSHKLI